MSLRLARAPFNGSPPRAGGTAAAVVEWRREGGFQALERVAFPRPRAPRSARPRGASGRSAGALEAAVERAFTN